LRKLLVLLLLCQLFFFVLNSYDQNILPDTTDQNKKLIEDKWLGKDKLKHFIACFYAAGFAKWYAYHHYGLSGNQSRRAGMAVSLSIGFSKEFFDKKRQRKFSWKDILFNLGGALSASLLIPW